MPKGVACSVSNCTYWDQGNRCGADEIVIEIDAHAGINLNEEFGEDEFDSHRDTASASSATCCQTFEPKTRK